MLDGACNQPLMTKYSSMPLTKAAKLSYIKPAHRRRGEIRRPFLFRNLPN